MAKATTTMLDTDTINDGGIICALLLLIGGLVFGIISSIVLYVFCSTYKSSSSSNIDIGCNIVRLLSGWSNICNAITHLLLVFILMFLDDETKQHYINVGIDDAENGPIGAIILMVINVIIGIRSIRTSSDRSSSRTVAKIPFVYNLFIAITGSLLPLVWYKFITIGLSTWPYIIIFLWFAIYGFELLSLLSSTTWYLLEKKQLEKMEETKEN